MKCPVCKNECGEASICNQCGFNEVGAIFLNKEDANLWYDSTLVPYRNKYLEQFQQFKIEDNVLIKIHKEYKQTTKINVPYGVKKISNKAFEGCDWITEVLLPETVEEIGTGAFRKCRNLAKILLPSKNVRFGKSVFEDCTNLQSIKLPEDMASIPYRMFFQCKNLSSITLPIKITKIGWQSFFACCSLTSVEIPDSVKTLDGCAFGFCESLHYLKIGKGVKKIADGAFRYCGELTTIECDNANYVVQSNSLINKKTSKLIRGCRSSSIPMGTKIIGEGAFSGCENIQEIQIPSTVIEIGEGAFSSCRKLSYIVIPNSVSVIGYNALFTDMDRRINVFCEHIEKPTEWHDVWYNKFEDLLGSQKCVFWANEWHYDKYGKPTPN